MKKTTLKDIAVKLNISISTVSRALQNNPRISKEIRDLVLHTAKELNYFANKNFDFTGLKKMNAIGIIVPKISYHLYAMAISGIEKIAEDNGMKIIICQSNESYERERGLIKELIEIGIAGLIVSHASETKNFSHFQEAKKHNIPLVFFNRLCDEVESDKVVLDNFRAAYEATQHLIEIGCKKITYIGGPKKLQISNTRLLGFKKAIENNKIRFDEKLIEHCDFTRESQLSTARKLLYTASHPDGILCFSDQIAISVMLAAKERGIKIPEDFSVIGFNNEPIDELLTPSLTSVDQPGYEMGIASAQLIINRIKNHQTKNSRKILKSNLIIRNSTNRNKQ
ncbi:LacI family DNA-binding transcriptional regulator [Bacteroidota bacterium]